MPWRNQGGGGPWGPQKGGGGPTPPNLEDLLSKGQERMRRILPGGVGGGRGLLLVVLGVLALWLITGFYRVDAGEQGVELLFGKWREVTRPSGLHYWFPAPIGGVETPNVEQVRRLDIGFRGAGEGPRRTAPRSSVPQESLMLTSDQNIADAKFSVFWRIRNAGEFLFNIRDPNQTVKIVAESAMREIVGGTQFEPLLTAERQQVEQLTMALLQKVLDEYKAGIIIQNVQLLAVEPPPTVIDAFNEVQRARQDKERLENQAEAYRNRIVPTARGEASRVVQDANAYRERVTKEAEGEGQRFIEVYDGYLTAPEVTRRRMYLETMTEVLSSAAKIIVDPNAQGAGIVPYLPLNELTRPRQGEGG